MTRRLRLWFVLLATLATHVPALAQTESLPQLTETQRQSIADGIQTGAAYGDPAFDALLDHTRSWHRLMHRWAASRALAPSTTDPREIDTLIANSDAAGSPVVIFGEFLEREPLAKYANVERWLVAPLDPNDPSFIPDRAVIIFVDRTTSAAFDQAKPGWFVAIAGHYYKPLMLPRRSTGEEVAYASFVGASFIARHNRTESSASGLFAFVGLGVALMIAALVVLTVIISKLRSKPSALVARREERLGGGAGAPVQTGSYETGLPSTPADALEYLSRNTDSSDNQYDA